MAKESTPLLLSSHNSSKAMEKICYSLIWILLLLFVAWPLAGFCAGWWLFFQPFEAFLGVVKEVDNFLEK
jgi:hypothetical protein